MTDFLVQIISRLNVFCNAAGEFLFDFISRTEGWLSNTIISAVMGVILLVIFKYTSNQRAIGKVRDNIKAQVLALMLFKDSLLVTLQAQGRIFMNAFLLLFHSIQPMAVMILPVCLVLAQMGLWYQASPLPVGEESIITMELNDTEGFSMPEVSIQPNQALSVVTGPVRVMSKGQIYWKIKAEENGYHKIVFDTGREQVEKDLSIGDGFMRVSLKRPGQSWRQILFNPWEKPFSKDSIVKSVSIEYPDRQSLTSGTGWWVIYFFGCSMIFAFIFKPFLKVKI
jgi:uncharacterized membrane protein (DUF106 family)